MKRKTLIHVFVMVMFMFGGLLLFSATIQADHDNKAPALTSVTINTPVVVKPGVASITLDLVEGETGIVDITFYLQRKDDKGNESISFERSRDAGGQSLFTGKHTFEVRIPSNKPSDQYYVGSVYLEDAAGNMSHYESIYMYDDSQQKNVKKELELYLDGNPASNKASSNGYLTVKDEFNVAFEYGISHSGIVSGINSMEEGSAGMILFNSNFATAKKEWFDAVKGKNKTLVFSNDGIQWMIYGKDINNDTKDIDLKITCQIADAADYGGQGQVVVLTFADNGTLPGRARIRLKANYLIGSGFNLYYKDGATISLERSDGKGYLDGDDKWVEFYVTHNSTFLLSQGILTKSNENPPAPPQEEQKPSEESPKPAQEIQKPEKEKITISKKPASVKTKTKKNKVTVSWKGIKNTKKNKKLLARIKKIQVQYSTDPGFAKNVKNKKLGKKKTQVKLTLKKKTKYYIRVRYVGTDGYSRWSKTKKVKTK